MCCTMFSGQVVERAAICLVGGSCMVSSYGKFLQCSTRSPGQVRRSLLSGGPLLYKCSIRSLAWLYVLVLYLVTSR